MKHGLSFPAPEKVFESKDQKRKCSISVPFLLSFYFLDQGYGTQKNGTWGHKNRTLESLKKIGEKKYRQKEQEEISIFL